MKKTKLLIPALSIAGLAAAVAPMVTMTSCSNNETWEASNYEALKAKMEPLYDAFNKQDNLKSFSQSDLIVKLNNVKTTNFTIQNDIWYDALQFDRKTITLKLGDDDVATPLFYPKKDIETSTQSASTVTVSKSNHNNYKLYIAATVGGKLSETTYIFNNKGFVSYHEHKVTGAGGVVEGHSKVNVEYKSNLRVVNNSTFAVDKKNNKYLDDLCILQNEKEYKLKVQKSLWGLSKFSIDYWNKQMQEETLDLQNGVTITAGGATVTTSWVTNHLEFNEIPTGTDITITINKNNLPNGCNYFIAQIYK